MSKLISAAASATLLASKIDDLKHQAKSLDEVIRALKKAITDMEDSQRSGPAGTKGTQLLLREVVLILAIAHPMKWSP